MRCRCPHCHNPIEIVDDDPLTDIECPSCGSHFELVGAQATASYHSTPKTIAHFELLDQVGNGKFGSVWKARDTELDRIVAIKIPRARQVEEVEAAQFLREARAAAQVKHPNIVSVHEVGREDGTIYIVSDFIDGANLKDYVSGGPTSFREAAELCATVADALHAAHEAGVIHRDLKPQNIMVDSDGSPHVADFGLAKREAGEITMTVDGQILGTPAYMPPEQIEKAHEVDRRADVYSLGVILYELLTGELPFRGQRQMVLLQIQRDEPTAPRKLNSRVPRDLETICLKCMEKDLPRRYSAAGDVAAECRRYLSGQPITASPVSRTERMWRTCKRNPMVAGLSVTVALALLAGTIASTCFAIAAGESAQKEAGERKRAERAEVAAKLRSLDVMSVLDDLNLEKLRSDRLAPQSTANSAEILSNIKELVSTESEARDILDSLASATHVEVHRDRLQRRRKRLRDEATHWLSLGQIRQDSSITIEPPTGLTFRLRAPGATQCAVSRDMTRLAIATWPYNSVFVFDNQGKFTDRLSCSFPGRAGLPQATLFFPDPDTLQLFSETKRVTWALTSKNPTAQIDDVEPGASPPALSGSSVPGATISYATSTSYSASISHVSSSPGLTVTIGETGKSKPPFVWSVDAPHDVLGSFQRFAFSADEQFLFVLTSRLLLALDPKIGFVARHQLSGEKEYLELIPTDKGIAMLEGPAGTTRNLSLGRSSKYQVSFWQFDAAPVRPHLLIDQAICLDASQDEFLAVGGKDRVVRGYRNGTPLWIAGDVPAISNRSEWSSSVHRAYPLWEFSSDQHLIVDRQELLQDGHSGRVMEVYNAIDGSLVQRTGGIVEKSRDGRFAVVASRHSDTSVAVDLWSLDTASLVGRFGEYAIPHDQLPVSFHEKLSLWPKFSPTCKYVALCDLVNARCEVWDVAGFKKLAELDKDVKEVIFDESKSRCLASTFWHSPQESDEEWLIDLSDGQVRQRIESEKGQYVWRTFVGERMLGMPTSEDLHDYAPIRVLELNGGEQWQLGETSWKLSDNIQIRSNRHNSRIAILGNAGAFVRGTGGTYTGKAELWDVASRVKVAEWPDATLPEKERISLTPNADYPLLENDEHFWIPVGVKRFPNFPVMKVKWDTSGPEYEAIATVADCNWPIEPALTKGPFQEPYIQQGREVPWVLWSTENGLKLQVEQGEASVLLEGTVNATSAVGRLYGSGDRFWVNFSRGDPPEKWTAFFEPESGRRTTTQPDGYHNNRTDFTGRWWVKRDEESREVVIWDAKSGELALRFKPNWHSESWRHTDWLKVDPSGRRLAILTNGAIVLWDAENNREVKTIEKPGHLKPISFIAQNPEARVVASADEDGAVLIWDRNTGKYLRTIRAHMDRVTGLAISPNGQHLVSSSTDGTLRLSTVEGDLIWSVRASQESSHLAFQPNSQRLYVGSSNGQVVAIDVSSGETIAQNGHNKSAVESIAMHAGGQQFATGHEDGTVQLWNARTCHLEAEWQVNLPVTALAYVGASDVLVVASDQVDFWRIADPHAVWSLEVEDAPVAALQILGEDRLVVVPTSGPARVYDLRSYHQAFEKLGLGFERGSWFHDNR